MYVLTAAYRHGSKFRTYGDDPDELVKEGQEIQGRGMITNWRVVNVGSGQMYDHWREPHNV